MTVNAHIAPLAGSDLSGGLTYLENRSDSSTVTIFLHGLGLDARDYQDYLESHDQHGIALTLLGFDPDSTDKIAPVDLKQHVRVVSDFIRRVDEKYSHKDLILVGFSLGADMILRLAEYWQRHREFALKLKATLLLDPNVNQSTMTISRLFAEADPKDPLPAFKQLIDLARDTDSLRTLCEYLVKVVPKDFTHVRQMSRDMIEYWSPDGHEQIGTRLAAVSEFAQKVRVVLSASYEHDLDAMKQAAREHQADSISFKLTKLEHFDLIGDRVLPHELREMRR
jgi:pimeloyl-ACP methyl ester carboxylesterase